MRWLTRFSHHLTAEARDKAAITSLRLLAVLTVLSRTLPLVKRRAPRTGGPLTHFASPRGEKSGRNQRTCFTQGSMDCLSMFVFFAFLAAISTAFAIKSPSMGFDELNACCSFIMV